MRLALAVLFMSAAFAQQPRIANARLETIAVSGLSCQINRFLSASAGPELVGYSEPMIAGEHHSCGPGCWIYGRVGRESLGDLIA